MREYHFYATVDVKNNRMEAYYAYPATDKGGTENTHTGKVFVPADDKESVHTGKASVPADDKESVHTGKASSPAK